MPKTIAIAVYHEILSITVLRRIETIEFEAMWINLEPNCG